MSKKIKRPRITVRLRTVKEVPKEKDEDFDFWRDRKAGSYNQLWDWNTLVDVEIKRV